MAKPRQPSLDPDSRSISARAITTSDFVLRTPLQNPRGRKAKYLIYARFSRDEQDASSIPDQAAYCKNFLLGEGVDGIEFEVLSDEATSGELASRPGIDEVRAGIRQRRWDLIISEDSSRLYRHETACMDLIEAACDEDIRVICINDRVDTAEEDWSEKLHEAQKHHTKSNQYTSSRIKRRHSALWEMGAAIGLPRPGYRRRCTIPATERQSQKGPFFDEIDLQWKPIIVEMFERMASGECPTHVAAWLNTTGLPKTRNATTVEWSDGNVKSLIRNPIYRGVEKFRQTITRKKRKSGRRTPERNEPRKVLVRNMPHLRMVADWLWNQANAAIDERDHNPQPRRGRENPLFGIPRDSRGPLSKLFVCVCGARMERIGPNGYRCAAANYKCGRCWMKATAKIERVHAAVRNAIIDRLTRLEAEVEQVLDALKSLCGGNLERDDERAVLQQEETQHERALQNLRRLAESADESPESVLGWITERQRNLDRVRADLERLSTEQSSVQVPTSTQILARIEELKRAIQSMNRESCAHLKLLVQKIVAVPFQQVGSDKVVLRARFEVTLFGLLPPRLGLFLRGLRPEHLPPGFAPTFHCVDLFEPSAGPRYAKDAVALADQGLGPAAIGRALGISKRNASIARDFGLHMRSQGVTDPFEELTAPPSRASRWRFTADSPPEAMKSTPATLPTEGMGPLTILQPHSGSSG